MYSPAANPVLDATVIAEGDALLANNEGEILDIIVQTHKLLR